MNKFITASLLFFLVSLNAFAQRSAGWNIKMEPAKVFIENKGQFKVPGSSDEVLFAVDHSGQSVFFTRSGVYYTFLKQWREKESEEEREREKKKKFNSAEEYKKHEEEEHRVESDWDIASFQWSNANAAVTIEGVEAVSDYYSYSLKDFGNNQRNINNIRAYKKIIYRNLYPNIDVEYEFHPDNGIKYSVILHPGADVSLLKMDYDKNISIKNSNLHIPTKFGDIIDHAPVTFYADNRNSTISSKYSKSEQSVSFSLEAYDRSRTVIIDPWVQSPTFGTTTWHCVWECEYDGAGNVYIIGGGASQTPGSQMKLMKYNSTGTLQWTYTTPYDTSNCWLGTFATDNAGNSYVTAGSVAQIQKIDNAGNLVWNNASPGGILSSAEFWNIVFNCDQSKLVIGGTGGPLMGLQAVIYNVDVATGNITAQASVAVGPMSSIPPNLQEVRSISSCVNGKYYFLTHDTIGSINQNFNLCPGGQTSLYKINNGVDFGYKCEDYRFDNSGIMGIRADGNYVFVNKGNQIQKRDLNTLAVLATATIPGGALNSVFLGGNTVSNSGIDIDACGNVYVGSKNQVVKFDQNLNQVATYTCSFNVYDVHVNTNGDVIASGSTGTSSTANRTGYVQVFSAAACSVLTLTCCDATICIPGEKCASDAPFTLTAATAGGTWSGTGITNASTGTFDPSVAGVGTHVITYSLTCGSQSISITVNNCQFLPVCIESNGNLTVTGTGPFTWYEQTTTTPCVSGFGTYCGPFTVAGAPVTSWTSFATGSTIDPTTGSYPMYVINSGGDSAYIASSAGLPSCTACSLTPQLLSQTNVSCFGGSNGSATVNATGGSGSNTYSWAPAGGTAATANGLAAGSYTCTITNGSCSTTQTVSITQPTSITTSTASTNASCGSANGSATVNASGGTGALTYSWLPGGQTTSTINSLSAGTYSCTVTDASSCTVAVTVVVGNSGGPTVSLSSQTNVSCNGGSDGAATVSASGGSGSYTYSWAPSGGTAATANGLAAAVYTVTVNDGTCNSTQTVSITQPAAITTSTASTNASCGSSNGSATVNASGGTGALTYSWMPGGATTSTISNVAAGTYSCTVTDANSCTVAVTVVVNNTGGPTVTLSSQTNVTCNGGSDGAATVGASGGSGSYTYSWAPSGGTAATANGLAAAVYTVTVNDGTCNSTQTVSITQPAAITTSTASTNASCGSSNGSATVNASGGTGALTYSWMPGGATTSTISNVAAGTYSCTVTDANSCTVAVTVVVNNTGGPTVTLSSQTNVTCNGGSDGAATVGASGGSGSYTYSWAPSGGIAASASGLAAGVYTVTVNDGTCISTQTVSLTEPTAITTSTTSTSASCGSSNGTAGVTASGGTGTLSYSWSPGGQTTSSISNLAGGTYTCVVTDASLCTNTVTVLVNSTGGATVSLQSQSNVLCNGGTNGSATVNATGGTGTLTYNWLPSGGTVATASGLAAGTYTCTITDGAGCTSTQTVSITEPTAISTTTASTNSGCGASTGSASVNASGGAGSFTYSWNPGGATTSSITNISAGTYICIITDANSCTDTVAVVVNSSGGATVSLSSQTNVSCNGGSNGSATVNATGGTGTLTYNWQPSGGTASTATSLAAGTYTCVVTDGAGCISSQTVTVTQPSAITTATTSTNASCGQSDGTATVNASGGAGTFTYLWQPGSQTTTTISSLAAGTYSCTVTDANSCSVTVTVIVNNNGGPTATATANGPLCEGGTLQLTASGGTSYSWSGPGGFTSTQQNPAVSNITTTLSGTYSVTVTNAGCSSTATVSVTIAAGPTVSVTAIPNSIYEGESSVLTASGGLTYSWTGTGNTASSITVTPVDTGMVIYCVYGTNAQGCNDSACVNIYVKVLDCGDLYVPTAFSPNNDGANDEFCLYGAQCVTELVFSIFDRWGEKVFESTDPGLCWDGTYKGQALFSAVFGYHLKAKLKSGEEVEKKGNISLIK